MRVGLYWVYFKRNSHGTRHRCLYRQTKQRSYCVIDARGKIRYETGNAKIENIDTYNVIRLSDDEAERMEAMLKLKPDNLLSLVLEDPFVTEYLDG